jgi:hypothetical protein
MHVGHAGAEAVANGIAEAAAITGIDHAAPLTTARRPTSRGDRLLFSISDTSVSPHRLWSANPRA